METRDPEKPANLNTDYIAAAEPSQVFENLQSSFKNKSIETYLACLVDTLFLNSNFRFYPSAGSVSKFPVLAEWGLEDEKQYIREVFTISRESIPIVLTLSGESSNIYGDSALYQFNYNLNLIAEDDKQSQVYQGTLKFNLKRDQREQWVIVEWTDIKDGELPSWSELKGEFY